MQQQQIWEESAAMPVSLSHNFLASVNLRLDFCC